MTVKLKSHLVFAVVNYAKLDSLTFLLNTIHDIKTLTYRYVRSH